MASNQFQYHKNTFEKGLNTDYNPNVVDASQYIDAANVTLVASGKFLALQNISGTTNVQAITSVDSTDVLAVFPTRYTIGTSTNVECLTIFTAKAGGNITIWCYDTVNVALYTLYQTTTPSDYFPTDNSRVIDGVLYPEQGLDILYFTDNYYEPRKIICNIQAPYLGPNLPFLTDNSLGLARRAAIGDIEFVSTASGGTLLTGTYQLAYQLININTNKYTRFSLLTTPIHVYSPTANYAFSGTNYYFAGVGMVSNQQISINIHPTDDELANYTHFRLAVVENVNPEGTIALQASVTEIQPISSYLSGGVITNYILKNNYQNSSVALDDIVIDTAAIAHIKSLTVKNNRLLMGNITYTNLTYNNGIPSATSGSILKQGYFDTSYKNSFNQPDFATKYRGYFRDEVYRYAISYFDKFGNYSSPRWLDMANVTNNQSTGYQAINQIFTNYDFATHDLTGWSQVSHATYTRPWAWASLGASGTGARVATNATADNSQSLYQPFTYTPGASYSLVWDWTTTATGNTGTSCTFTLQVEYMDSSFVSIGTYTVDTIVDLAATVTHHTGTVGAGSITPPSNTAYIGIRVLMVRVLDFVHVISAIVSSFNLIQTGGTDMKFPDRSQKLGSDTYTLFNSSGQTQSLGLHLVGIDHHPTWAQGFIILRAPRKKNILFQTPLIPMMSIYGIGPLDNYPTIAKEGVAAGTVTYNGVATGGTGLQASPMGPDVVMYPMNLAWPKKRSIVKTTAPAGAAAKTVIIGEAQLVNDPPLTQVQIFPSGTMFSLNLPYVFSNSHQVKTIDACVVDATNIHTYGTNTNGTTSWSDGDGDTSCSYSFEALADNHYYYDSGHSGAKAALRSVTNSFSAYAPFATGSPGTTLNGKFVLTPDKLQTGGVPFGFNPDVQKCAVAELASTVTSINDTSGLTFAAGAVVAKVTEPTNIFSGATNRINTLEIANIIAGLNDGRYGSTSTLTNYIYTGTKVVFTTSELAQVAAGTSLPKTVDVWGGDCFVGPFNYKIADSSYSVVNQDKYVTAGTGYTDAVGIAKWGRVWDNAAGSAVLALPVALRNYSQYLAVVLESEYNGTTRDYETADIAISNTMPIFHAASEYKCRSPLTYSYNFNLNKQNDQKIFIPTDPLNPVLVSAKARIVYTNINVYNTSLLGFDTVPVLNFYDLPEAYGAITKLAVAGNQMYSIQQRAIAYVPVDQQVIQTADNATNLNVSSGVVINLPVWVDIKRGGQHLRAIKETGTNIYIIDNENEAIYNLGDKGLNHISDHGFMTVSRTLFSAKLSEQNLITVHDILRNEIWFASKDGSFCYVWNENYGCWVSNYTWSSGNLMGGSFINNKLYLVGRGTDNNQLSVHSMYTNSTGGFLMGANPTSYVQFVVNPNPDFGKVFDDLLVNATDSLSNVDWLVEREAALGNQVVNGTTLGVTTRGEGNYRIKTLRAANGARLRGGKAKVKVNWLTGQNPVMFNSAVTQWRESDKNF